MLLIKFKTLFFKFCYYGGVAVLFLLFFGIPIIVLPLMIIFLPEFSKNIEVNTLMGISWFLGIFWFFCMGGMFVYAVKRYINKYNELNLEEKIMMGLTIFFLSLFIGFYWYYKDRREHCLVASRN